MNFDCKRFVLGSSSGSVQVFDLSVGLLIREFNLHSSPIRYVIKMKCIVIDVVLIIVSNVTFSS